MSLNEEDFDELVLGKSPTFPDETGLLPCVTGYFCLCEMREERRTDAGRGEEQK